MPFFSIIIPTYNSEEKIAKAIDSVLYQTFSDFEICVIDGASSDNTMEIVSNYALEEKRVKFISEKDRGIYDAMNKGIVFSSGNWIYFLGSDDTIYSKDVLQIIYSYCTTTKAAILYGNVKMDGDTGWSKHGDIYDGPFNLHKLMWQNICHQAIFYHRSVFKKIGNFNTDYKICADWDFNLHCFASVDFHYIDLIVALYYGGGVSAVNEDTAFMTDKLNNTIKYFQNKLYYSEFVQIRPQLRKRIFDKKSSLNWMIRVKLLISSFILQLKTPPTNN
jgi:glycosyltransferase involved in cell wall biosynthesis